MEKKKNLYTMFTKWSVSYIVLSVVAIGTIFYCSMRYTKAMKKELEYTNAVQMEMIQIQMDRTVANFRSFANRASMNTTVKELRNASAYADVNSYDLYKLVKNLGKEMLFDTDTHDCYLYFPVMDGLMSGRYYNNSRDFFDISMSGSDFSYEDFFTIISGEYRTSQIFPLRTVDGEEKTLLLKPLDATSRQTPPVYAIMIIDLNEMMKSSSWSGQGRESMGIIDQTNHRMSTTASLSEKDQNSLLEMMETENLPEKGTFTGRTLAKGTVVSFLPSKYENWDYAVITGEQANITEITELQRLVVMLVLGYLAVSGCAIGYAGVKHYRPLRKMVDILEQEGGNQKELSSDAYDYISNSVEKLLDQNKTNNSVIMRQKNAISKSVFHRLLTEKHAYESLGDELLNQCGIPIGDSWSYVLSYRMKKRVENLPEDMKVDSQEVSWFILKNVTEENLSSKGFQNICYKENEGEQIFLIWSEIDDAETVREAIREVLEISRTFIADHFKYPYHAALSEIHEGAAEIWQAYQEVEMVFQYQKKENGTDVISYGQINLLSKDTLLRYPIDVEKRLTHSIMEAKTEEACAEIEMLLQENRVNCLAPEAMQYLVSNIISSIIRSAGKMVKETSMSSRQKSLMETCRQNDREQMEKELKNLVIAVCQEVEAYNQREKEEEKDQLYQVIRRYVEEHYKEPELSVNSIAEQFHVQAAYLSKLFRKMENGKLSQYIHEVRLDYAKEMLLENARMEDVAIGCGFGSQRTFLRIFKQYEGITPTQWKELEEKKRKEEMDL